MLDRYALLAVVLLCSDMPSWAQAYGELDISGVRARFYANGRVAFDPQSGTPHFEVPQGSGVDANYCGELWVGGHNPLGEVRFSGSTYDIDSSTSFFPGPLTADGTASTTQSVVDLYDHVWKVDRTDVAEHLAYFNCLTDPNCDVAAEFPGGYAVPAGFLDWPAHGPMGYAPYLAPFYDFNSDGAYNPADGDAPCILGDQALYNVFGDHMNFYQGNSPIGIEVQAMPFTYASGDPMRDQTVFVRYHLINRSAQVLADARVGFFNDFEIGCADDDFIGCDPSRNLAYAYNWQDVDNGCNGALGYGGPTPPPPAFGMVLIKGPLADANGNDDPVINVLPNWSGYGFGDAITDNERYGMSNFMYFNRVGANSFISDPSTVVHYYNYLSGKWKDGTTLTYGGNGYSLDPSAVQCAFMYPGGNDPVGVGTGGIPQADWSEVVQTPNTPDRRGVMSAGPITLEPGQHMDLLYAYVYARATSGGAIASVGALQARVDSIRAFAQSLPIWNVSEESGFAGQCADYATIGLQEQMGSRMLSLSPSPASMVVNFVAPRELVGGQFTMRDATGRVLYQQRVLPDRNTIDVSALAKGVYLCEAVARNVRYTGRIVKE